MKYELFNNGLYYKLTTTPLIKKLALIKKSKVFFYKCSRAILEGPIFCQCKHFLIYLYVPDAIQTFTCFLSLRV